MGVGGRCHTPSLWSAAARSSADFAAAALSVIRISVLASDWSHRAPTSRSSCVRNSSATLADVPRSEIFLGRVPLRGRRPDGEALHRHPIEEGDATVAVLTEHPRVDLARPGTECAGETRPQAQAVVQAVPEDAPPVDPRLPHEPGDDWVDGVRDHHDDALQSGLSRFARSSVTPAFFARYSSRDVPTVCGVAESSTTTSEPWMSSTSRSPAGTARALARDPSCARSPSRAGCRRARSRPLAAGARG